MVADPPEDALDLVTAPSQPLLDVLLRLAKRRIVKLWDASHHHPRPVESFPLEDVFREGTKGVVGTTDQIGVVAVFGENLNQSSTMPKRVKIDCCRRAHAELFLKIRLPALNLPAHRLSGRQVAIRLQIPAAHDLPAPRLH